MTYKPKQRNNLTIVFSVIIVFLFLGLAIKNLSERDWLWLVIDIIVIVFNVRDIWREQKNCPNHNPTMVSWIGDRHGVQYHCFNCSTTTTINFDENITTPQKGTKV